MDVNKVQFLKWMYGGIKQIHTVKELRQSVSGQPIATEETVTF